MFSVCEFGTAIVGIRIPNPPLGRLSSFSAVCAVRHYECGVCVYFFQRGVLQSHWRLALREVGSIIRRFY